jgi:TRAP-type uncharacterized transport system fused permease subunit
MKTSIESVKLASWIFVMPFLFIYTPLLLTGETIDIAATVVACLIGIVAWAGFLEGFLFKYATIAERILLGLAAVFLMLPIDHLYTFLTPYEGEYHYQAYAVGLVLMGTIVILQWMRRAPEEAQVRTA